MTIFEAYGVRRSGSHLIANYVMHGHGMMLNVQPSRVGKPIGKNNHWPCTFSDKGHVAFVFEDVPFEKCGFDAETRERLCPGTSAEPIRYIHLRNIYNTVASRVATTNKWSSNPPHGYKPWVGDLWKSFARKVLEGYPAILYDRLFDEEYRKNLWISGDPNVFENKISFSGFKHCPGKAPARWLEVEMPEEIMDDTELRELNHEIFGC